MSSSFDPSRRILQRVSFFSAEEIFTTRPHSADPLAAPLCRLDRQWLLFSIALGGFGKLLDPEAPSESIYVDLLSSILPC